MRSLPKGHGLGWDRKTTSLESGQMDTELGAGRGGGAGVVRAGLGRSSRWLGSEVRPGFPGG